jgi:hypothetical protein
MAVILLFVGLTPVFSQEIIATFNSGIEYLNNDLSGDVLTRVNFLFVRPSGFTFSTGFDVNRNMNFSPIFGLGYIHNNKYYVGGILNLISTIYVGEIYYIGGNYGGGIFISPTIIGGYDFGQFSLGGQLSYIHSLTKSISGFRFYLGTGIKIGNSVSYNDTQSTQAEAETPPAEEISPTKETNNEYFSGFYIEATIPPFLKQVWNDAPVFPFGGGPTYMDFGLGVALFSDILKAQINYGFLTQALYERLGGIGPVRYGGHVLGFKFFAGPEINFGKIFGSSWDRISASFGLGLNFSLFDLLEQGYTQSGTSAWMSSFVAQLEFPKVTLTDRKIFKGFSLFTEGQLWYVPTDVYAKRLGIRSTSPHIVMGLRLYIF